MSATPAWSPGDYPCAEQGWPPGERCSEPECGRLVVEAELRRLEVAMFAAARVEPTTPEVVEQVQRLVAQIQELDELLASGRL